MIDATVRAWYIHMKQDVTNEEKKDIDNTLLIFYANDRQIATKNPQLLQKGIDILTELLLQLGTCCGIRASRYCFG